MIQYGPTRCQFVNEDYERCILDVITIDEFICSNEGYFKFHSCGRHFGFREERKLAWDRYLDWCKSHPVAASYDNPSEVSIKFDEITEAVKKERIRQGELHPGKTPRWNTDHNFNGMITLKELGEVSRAIQDRDFPHAAKEAVETIACLYAWIEGMLDRDEIYEV